MTAFVVTPEVVNAPQEALRRLLEDPALNERQVARERLARYELIYEKRYGVRLRFDEEAALEIVERCLRDGVEPREVCEALFRSYEHGLSLIRKNTGAVEFVVTPAVLAAPDRALEQWVRESFAARRGGSGERVDEVH
jgi:hypothetical protein